MCAVSKRVLCGKKLRGHKVVKVCSKFPKEDYILLTGKVLSPEKIPLSNAAIKIMAIDLACFPVRKRYIGVTFTDEKGTYGISIPRFLGISYELKAYAAIYTRDTN